MSTIELTEQTRELLEEPLLGEEDIEIKILKLMEAEYLRRIQRYRRVDQILSKKYGMSFDEFLSRRVVAQRDFDWEVEQDAMDWETAVDGIATIKRKLARLRVMQRA